MPLLEPIKTALSVPHRRALQRTAIAFRHGTPKKLLNFLIVESQLRLGAAKLAGHPYEWEIDLTNICQLKCPLCHTGLGNVNRAKGFMAYDLYRKAIDQIKDYAIWLSLYSWGEPLLHRELPKFLAYAHGANIATVMSSNLNAHVSPERAEEIVASGLDSLIISLDGVTQEVYQQYRVRGRLENVMKNIRLLVETKRRLRSKTPFLEWQFIVMRHNEHQIPEARKMAKELGVNLITFKKVDFPHGIYDEALAKRFLPESAAKERKERPFDKPYNEDEGGKCWRLWRTGIINWDGGYAPCCYLTDAKDDFGNINTDSIRVIQNNQSYIAARKLFSQKGYLPTFHIGCTTCNVYLSSVNGRKTASALASKGEAARASSVAVLPTVSNQSVRASKPAHEKGK
ncbi:MAG: radical SAM protein [Chloroflexi bacterium]|nr:radical SAM protein [Chloroflexota bacterium]